MGAVSYTQILSGLHAIMDITFIVETMRGPVKIQDCGVGYSQFVHVCILNIIIIVYFIELLLSLDVCMHV